MTPSETREKTNAEIEKLAHELEEEIFRLKFRKGAGQLKQTAGVKKARRDLARAKTVLRERALGIGKEAAKS